jgi:carbohydrate-binding DOMON domain-containing protein
MTNYKVKNQNLDSNFKLNFTQPTTQILREYQPLNYNLNKQNLSIDSRILPLFRTPLLRKKSEEIQVDINKYNLNIKNNLNHNFSNQILKIFLKGITLYNLNLKNFLLQGNKLNLILNIKNDKLYELNTRISNFFQRVNKLIFELNEKTVSSKFNNSKKTLIKKSDSNECVPELAGEYDSLLRILERMALNAVLIYCKESVLQDKGSVHAM